MKLLERALLGLLFGAAGAAACGAQSGAQPAMSSLEGTVLHEPGGEPIRKVVVQLLAMNADARVFAATATENGTEEAEAIEAFSNFAGSEGLDEHRKYAAATDAEGRFKFEQIPPGTYIISISRDGYVPVEEKPRGMVITVVEGQNLAGLTYKMATAGLIAGKITDADGDPLSGLTVRAIPKGEKHSGVGGVLTYLSIMGAPGNLPGMATTNDLGEYRIAGLRAGQYLVIARPRGNVAPPPTPANKARPGERLLYAPTYYPGVFEEKQASPLQVVSGGAATADFTLLVHHAYRVSGIVSGLINAKGSYILLMSNSARPQQQPLGEGGKFEFPSLEPGTYFAQVYDVAEIAKKEGPRIMTVPTPIVVSGSDIADLVLQPFANGKVSGKFRAEGEDRVDWAEMAVTLMHIADPGENTDKGPFEFLRQGGSGNLGEDGTFEITDVVPGNYQVAVVSQSDKYRDWYLKSLLFAGREVADTGFAVAGETSLDVVVSRKGASIEGAVVDGKGKPAAGVFVVTLPSSDKLARPDSYQTTKTDAKGGFLLRGLNPGEFTVVALENLQTDARGAEFHQKYGSQGVSVSLTEGERKNVTPTLTVDESK